MKISEIIKHFTQIEERFGDLDVESGKFDFGAVEEALNKNNPFPVELKIKPPPSEKRPDAL